MIVCLGWGSLIWCPGTLPCTGGWHCDGPNLPIEFARQSRDGRVTLVIEQIADPVPTLWTQLRIDSLDDARRALADRENVCLSRYPRSIGHWSPANASQHNESAAIGDWARLKGADAAVWTALKPRFDDRLMTPTSAQVIAYLRSLDEQQKTKAEEYVRKAPQQIKTAYRKAIELALGWTALLDRNGSL